MPPFQGLFVFRRETQGVALGWLVCAPLVLLPIGCKVHDRFQAESCRGRKSVRRNFASEIRSWLAGFKLAHLIHLDRRKDTVASCLAEPCMMRLRIEFPCCFPNRRPSRRDRRHGLHWRFFPRFHSGKSTFPVPTLAARGDGRAFRRLWRRGARLRPRGWRSPPR